MRKGFVYIGLILLSGCFIGCQKQEEKGKNKPSPLVLEEEMEIEEAENLEESPIEEVGREAEAFLQGEFPGGDISFFLGDGEGKEEYSFQNHPMQSASLIKLFVAGSVYENFNQVKTQEQRQGETESLIRSMLSVSDNDSCNLLIERLGGGRVEEGMRIVNAFCVAHGYTETKMQRLMLASKERGDNWTTPRDCGRFLQDVLQNRLSGSEAILEALKHQERRGKLPTGIPQGVETANKTGELVDVENDAMIVFREEGPYVLCVMMEDLNNTERARAVLGSLSQNIYEGMQ